MKPFKIPVRKSIWWYLRNDEVQMNFTFLMIFIAVLPLAVINSKFIVVQVIMFLILGMGIYFFGSNLIRILRK